MNQINPLHIGAVLVVLLAFLFFKLSDAKSSLQEEKLLYQESKNLALQLSSLKEIYGQKEKTLLSVKRLLSQSSIKSSGVTMQQSKEGLILSAKSMNLTALNSLMGKLINGSYKIAALNIERVNESHASLKVEIKW